jgi:Protein of unknown function (DUF2752)
MSFYFLNITSWLEAHQLPCLFKAVTHFDCPGCGIQRSFILLIKGDFTESFLVYPALLPIILLFTLLILQVTSKIKNGAAILKFAYIFIAGIILVSYIYKLIITKTL